MTKEPAAKKILIIKLGALGDFIQALGPMAAIRKHHKGAHITLLTTAPFEDFASSCGYCDEVWIDEKPDALNIAGWLNMRKQLNEAKFDRVYDLQNNDRTSFYFKLFKKKPEWVGAAKGASHRNTSPDRTTGHAFDGHAQTLALADIKNVTVDPLEWMVESISSFPLQKPFVLLVPGSAPQHKYKRWPADKYGRLAKILSGGGYQPVILGSKTEKDIAAAIKNICPEALNLSGQTSFKHIATMARSAATAIGNDTGPMHLIAATGCPCIALFSGRSNKIRHAPKGAGVQILQEENLEDLTSEFVMRHFKPREIANKKTSTLH